MQTIACYTLFDITNTGVLNRSKPVVDMDYNDWSYKRNTQCNFDTILQAVSLRSLPEIQQKPKKIEIKFSEFTDFGFLFEEETPQNCWYFTFNVMSTTVFNDGISELGSLYDDCHNVPMIKCGTEYDKLPEFLNVSPELKNIHFKIVGND